MAPDAPIIGTTLPGDSATWAKVATTPASR